MGEAGSAELAQRASTGRWGQPGPLAQRTQEKSCRGFESSLSATAPTRRSSPPHGGLRGADLPQIRARGPSGRCARQGEVDIDCSPPSLGSPESPTFCRHRTSRHPMAAPLPKLSPSVGSAHHPPLARSCGQGPEAVVLERLNWRRVPRKVAPIGDSVTLINQLAVGQ